MSEAPYDEIAEWFDGLADDSPEDEALRSSFLGLVGDVQDKRICDFACGSGASSRILAEKGAKVVGIDISTRLIELARDRERAHPLKIEYRVGDLRRAETLNNETFDLIVCNEGLMAVDQLLPLLAAAYSALKPDGRFIFSITHPCFVGPHATPRDGGRAGSAASAGYFDEVPWRTANREGVNSRVDDHHRTLSTYFNNVLAAGFDIERIAEPHPGQGGEGGGPNARPLHLVVKCCARAGERVHPRI